MLTDKNICEHCEIRLDDKKLHKNEKRNFYKCLAKLNQNSNFNIEKKAIIKTRFKNLSILPATINLAGIDIELVEKAYQDNIMYFDIPREIKEANMRDIDINDKNRVKAIKYLKDLGYEFKIIETS